MAINLTRNQIQTPSAPTVQQERQELAVVEYDIQELTICCAVKQVSTNFKG